MSSITNRPNGHRWICYKHNGKRHTIRLGAVSDKDAKAFQVRIDRLIDSRRLGVPLDIETTAWLAKLGERPHANLVTAGLLSDRGPGTIAELVKRHEQHLIAKDREESTLVNSRVLYNNLIKHFGPLRRLDAISLADADGFRKWLLADGRVRGGSLEPSTVTNRCRRARSVFSFAIKSGWASANPFRELGQGSEANPERNEYITRELYDQILAGCNDPEVRLMLAIPRYMGLRSPSETRRLKWVDVDQDGGVLRVYAKKTKTYREVPIFEEIAPLFQAAKAANPDSELMFPQNQISGSAITDKLAALCRKADEVLWEKPFVNLRASCERDWLASGKSIDTVAAWIGHTPEVMLRHYNRVAKELSARSATTALRLTPGTTKRRKKRSTPSVQKRLG